jgi:excisionase family DNA binding protein
MRSKAARPPIESPIMTMKEVAAYLRIHRSTIYRMVRVGRIPAFRVRADWRFNKATIDRWRKECSVPIS